jgi:hypothetical protein
MGLAERRLILRSGGSAGWRSLALGAVETVLIAGWSLLLLAAVRLLTGRVLPEAVPPCYLVAAGLATWLERKSRRRRGSPLTSLGLEAVATGGHTPGPARTFLRLLLTPPSLLCAFAGYLPLIAGARPVPEMLSGTMMLSLQPQLDPRPQRVIRSVRTRSGRLVISYSLLSLAAGMLVFLVPVSPPARQGDRHLSRATGLSGEDGALLVYYLDNVQRHPDSLEFHVRLASLYYRNDMEGDLAVELREIARLDPDHPMLLLGEDLSVDIDDLLRPESAAGDSAVAAMVAGTSGDGTAAPDSAAAGGAVVDTASAALPADSSALTPEAEPDTTAPAEEAPPDSAAREGGDSTVVVEGSDSAPDSLGAAGKPPGEGLPGDSTPGEGPDSLKTAGPGEPQTSSEAGDGPPDYLPPADPPETQEDTLERQP